MPRGQDPNLPDELRFVEARLRQRRLDASPADLDRVKRQALSQFRSRGQKVGPLRARLATAVTGVVLLAGAGGAVALSGLDSHPNTNGGAADKQYKPPKGCHKHPHKKKCGRPPKAHTGPAHDVTKNSAALTGRVIVYNHTRTKYYFVWGVCPHLNHRAGFGETTSSKNVSVTITGLQPGTKYCYEVVATNSHGTGRGGVRTFHTDPAHKSGKGGKGKGKKGHHGHHSQHGPRQPVHPSHSRGFTG